MNSFQQEENSYPILQVLDQQNFVHENSELISFYQENEFNKQLTFNYSLSSFNKHFKKLYICKKSIHKNKQKSIHKNKKRLNPKLKKNEDKSQISSNSQYQELYFGSFEIGNGFFEQQENKDPENLY